jgi:hypothetical protein
VCEEPSQSLASVCALGGPHIRFHRSLDQQGMIQWNLLLSHLHSFSTTDAQDRVVWHLPASGRYTVQSMYHKLSQGASVSYHKDVWEAKVPLKIKIFAWLLILDRLPSMMLVTSRPGPATGACALCGSPYDSAHILFSCSMEKFSWSVMHSLLGCNWCPANFAQFHAILSSFSGQATRIFWILFLA